MCQRNIVLMYGIDQNRMDSSRPPEISKSRAIPIDAILCRQLPGQVTCADRLEAVWLSQVCGPSHHAAWQSHLNPTSDLEQT